MKLLTPQQMKSIDRIAIDSLGIPGIVLMENAAIQVVKKAKSLLKGKGASASITVVAGSGNNGGDAFAVVRHLLAMGYSVSVYSMTSMEALIGDALTNGLILKNMGMEIPIISDSGSSHVVYSAHAGETVLERLVQSLEHSDLVIDGLLGTGLNRNVEGLWAQVIQTINDHAKTVLSIDIASGVDGLTGKIRGISIRADATVTFYLPKLGMVQYPGASRLGELTVADIGIPYQLAEELDVPELVENADIAALLPQRPEDGHKGTFGRLLAVAGSQGMSGAAYLSAASAYRSGCGLVKLAVPQSCMDTLSMLVPEAVLVQMPENNGHICIHEGQLDDGSTPAFLKGLIQEADAVLVGPGLSCNEDTRMVLKYLIENCEKPMVFDADALNILARDKTLLENLRCEAILTPHPAEMARLAGIETELVQNDRIGLAKQFADEYGITVVLKGAGTVIATNDGRVAINPTGNDGMGTAGAGDVLAGMIASLLGQGVSPYEAALAGVYLHGLAGDFAAQEKGRICLMASDIVAHIPDAFKHLMGLENF